MLHIKMDMCNNIGQICITMLGDIQMVTRKLPHGEMYDAMTLQDPTPHPLVYHLDINISHSIHTALVGG